MDDRQLWILCNRLIYTRTAAEVYPNRDGTISHLCELSSDAHEDSLRMAACNELFCRAK